jgi:hypothetical protein
VVVVVVVEVDVEPRTTLAAAGNTGVAPAVTKGVVAGLTAEYGSCGDVTPVCDGPALPLASHPVSRQFFLPTPAEPPNVTVSAPCGENEATLVTPMPADSPAVPADVKTLPVERLGSEYVIGRPHPTVPPLDSVAVAALLRVIDVPVTSEVTIAVEAESARALPGFSISTTESPFRPAGKSPSTVAEPLVQLAVAIDPPLVGWAGSEDGDV